MRITRFHPGSIQVPSEHLTSHPWTIAAVSTSFLRLHPWCQLKRSSVNRDRLGVKSQDQEEDASPKRRQHRSLLDIKYYGGTPMRHRKTACFEALVLEPHFAQSCGHFLLLYCILWWQSSLQASFHWKMQNVKLPVCPTPAGCICSNSGATVEQFAQRASETGEQSFAMGTF